jgi:hypothetical protein
MLHPATTEARLRELATCRSVLYTPPVTYTARAMEREIAELRRRLHYVVEDVTHVYQFHSLSTEEVRFILEHKWQQIGARLQPDDFSDMEAVATVIRITGGNSRLIHRLCTQIERILHINEIRMVTKEVVEAAREQLVIGQV